MGEEPKNNFQMGRGIQNCCNMLPQLFYFQQNVIRHSKKQERVTHIQKKKASNKNCLREGPNVRLDGQRLQRSHYKYSMNKINYALKSKV